MNVMVEVVLDGNMCKFFGVDIGSVEERENFWINFWIC